MDRLTKEDLRILMGMTHGASVSMYLPTHRSASKNQEDRIRFKNLLRNAEGKLKERGESDPGEILAHAYALHDDSMFWRHQSDGLAVFVSPDYFRSFRLPVSFKEMLVAARRFHIKPLISFLTNDQLFYVLALSLNRVRLLECSRQSCEEIQTEGVPEGIGDTLKYDEFEKQIQYHTGASSGGGRRPAMFHGQGVGNDDNKDNILRYLTDVNKGIKEYIKEPKAPVILAGVDYVLSMYLNLSSLPNDMEKGIPGNPDNLSNKELHARAWEQARSRLEGKERKALERISEIGDAQRVSRSVREVVPAAFEGRVEELFVPYGKHVWGAYDAAANSVDVHDPKHPGDEDLLDLAAVQTLMRGGTVYALEPSRIPDGNPLAAVYRY